jgi:hypothetical protein
MLAIGILAVGLAMSMSVFPAAVKQNEASFDDVLGSIIAENGLTVAETLLSASDVTGELADKTTTIDPTGTPTYVTRYPFKESTASNVTGEWQVVADDNTLIVLAYRWELDADDNHVAPPAPTSISGSIDSEEDASSLTGAPSGLDAGTYIFDEDGNYARIISGDGTYTLDRGMPTSSSLWKAEDAIAVRSAKVSLN